MEDKKRIMNMVKEGKITAEEAIRLLEAMESGTPQAAPGPGLAYAVASTPSSPKGIARMLRIVVDGEEVKLKVNLPAALAKFAANFIPPETKQQLSTQGIDLVGILDMLKGELPEGRLLDMEVNEVVSEENGATKVSGPVKVLIEVV
jgi:polyhydroxyalkanoate synthesis regulator phasin